MSIVVCKLMTRICIAYLDDVIIYSRNHYQHVRNLTRVFEHLRVAGLNLKPFKCQLFKDNILYVGNVFNPLAFRLTRLNSVCCPTCRPRKNRDVQSFRGFIKFYGEFIPYSTHLTAPFYILTVGKENTVKMTLTPTSSPFSKA